MRFDESGLPKPGRELDAWIAENIMGIKCGACLQDGKLEPITMDWGEVPHHSTSHAYHSVMDAMEGWLFEFWEEDYGDEGHRLTANTYQGPTPADFICTAVYEAEVSMADYPDRERTYAHAVCAAVWKAMGGE